MSTTGALGGHRPHLPRSGMNDPEAVGRLHSLDISTGVDGPGTRFVAFLAGCPLRCLYCQNPDTWHMRDGTATTAAAVLRQVDRRARSSRAGLPSRDRGPLPLARVRRPPPDPAVMSSWRTCCPRRLALAPAS